ncbi:hypothetical protein ABIQ69_00165 [Agromyces sp. G08B096]|uniref:Anti-sigma factor n=1 Tax=Agromyces sp. G08B096 TaxID=3156399 RepID=A0AAU7W9F0_9MICO
MDASEYRIRDLQRIAYGADSTDAERASAVDELAALAARGLSGPTPAGGPPENGPADVSGHAAHPSDPDAASRQAPGAAAAPAKAGPSRHRTERARLARWVAVAGLGGLVVGGFLGWAAAQRAGPDEGMPLEETELLALIDQLPLAAESSRVANAAEVEGGIDETSVRLLASRLDGPAAYIARTSDGEELCLVLLLPGGTSRSACTVDGRLPRDGLRVPYAIDDRDGSRGLSVGRLDAGGTVTLPD